jgi:hypothetical protein
MSLSPFLKNGDLHCPNPVFFLEKRAGSAQGKRNMFSKYIFYFGRGYVGTVLRVRAVGTRVNGYRYNGFFPKKMTGPSQTRTRISVYPPIPGHGYGYRGYGPRVHGYGLYPAGFSKPLHDANENARL